MAHDLTLILGGARSGKSAFAEAEVTSRPGPWHYMATAQAFDDEMRDRIAQHRADRAPAGSRMKCRWRWPMPADRARRKAPVLVDCLTLWLTNHLLAETTWRRNRASARRACRRRGPVWLVANEVGLGIVPDNALARRFRDEAGRLNQRIARQATRVRFIAAGLPMAVKG